MSIVALIVLTLLPTFKATEPEAEELMIICPNGTMITFEVNASPEEVDCSF